MNDPEDTPAKILADLNALDQRGVEKPSILPPNLPGAREFAKAFGVREGLADGKDWMQRAAELGWTEERLEAAVNILNASRGTLLHLTANVIVIQCESGNVWQCFRENSSACMRAGEQELRTLELATPG
jgi:hypothetical protein